MFVIGHDKHAFGSEAVPFTSGPIPTTMPSRTMTVKERHRMFPGPRHGRRAALLALALALSATADTPAPATAAAKNGARHAPHRHSSGHHAPKTKAKGKRPRPARLATPYRAGAASRSINPDPDGTWHGQRVFLGGYGIGGGTPLLAGRPATGVLGDGISVRAFAVTGGGGAMAVADIETQGMFAGDRDGPYGLDDIRRAVARRTGGALPAGAVVVQADHSHSGPDTMGVWGGVPADYRRHIAEQAVEAIVDAYEHRRPAALRYGTADGTDLLSNQFGYDAAHGNDVLDGDVRVLQAVDRRAKPFATLLNFSAHPTVLGAGNTKASGDWVQEAGRLGPKKLGGGPVVTMVGTLGRTQPADRDCPDASLKDDAEALCRLDAYAGRVLDRAAKALKAAEPVHGPTLVRARTYTIHDVSTSALILGLNYLGAPLGFPFVRPTTPPYLTGTTIATTTASARIGDVLLSAGPGEMYPQIPLKVRSIASAAQGYMTAGLAGDQLGYLIAPYRAYPEPIRRSLFNQRGDEISPLDNDNYFFNVSLTMGTRVMCSLLRGAGEVLGRGSSYRDADHACTAFDDDLAQAGTGASR